ncbi:tripartite tricarboxylate transporter TctB family protein [Celeribacter halophilus]|uniref:Tripartite tricarboxylate transporter TctB family protein n=1 Tax=Celeribacter halophilus TaxID=576117 RepID=A0A1I3TCX4_9RHOB|nr:tripartite tricarboxylate transporter TctB family protein [Celeribacter halophilus]PZX11180.1 tripartite tricarboxylate transporter TctB family protein [Celeribacter halophilus]SFJ67506.1 Tripartite tricarboxylate transporter TctB family protein [Celeribacter halophilus]
MTKPVLRGVLIVAFFALCAFVLVPAFVPRPAFIPGFAPPPDMWPRTVSIVGVVLGALAIFLALRGGQPVEEKVETDGSSVPQMLLRFAGIIAIFVLFFAVVPYVGFLIATMFLTLAMVLMTGERHYRIWIALLSFGGPVLLVLFFHSALGTQFPKGELAKLFGF